MILTILIYLSLGAINLGFDRVRWKREEETIIDDIIKLILWPYYLGETIAYVFKDYEYGDGEAEE